MDRDTSIALVLGELDNVATSFADIAAGESVRATDQNGSRTSYVARSHIPYGHKFAVRLIRKGESIIKYGEPIGVASSEIPVGEHVHVHNLESARVRGDLL